MQLPQIPSRLDHILYAVPDLEQGIDSMERRLGVRAAIGGRHEAFGTRNALLALGDEHYLEIIAADRGAASPPSPRIFGLDDLSTPVLISWVARERDIDGFVREAQSRGAVLGAVLDGSRTKPDGSSVTWKCTNPAAVITPGVLPFFIDWGTTITPARSAPGGCTLTGFRAEHPRPDEARAALARLDLDLEVSDGERPAFVASIATPNGTVELK